jgi:hypothetical protein
MQEKQGSMLLMLMRASAMLVPRSITGTAWRLEKVALLIFHRRGLPFLPVNT